MLTIAISVLIKNFDQELNAISNQIKNLSEQINFDSKNTINILYVIQTTLNVEFNEIESKIKSCNYGLKINCIYGGLGGVANSRNIAINFAQTKYLLFFDLDCRFKCSIQPLLNHLKDETYEYIYFANKENYSGDQISLLPRMNITVLNRFGILGTYFFWLIAIVKSPTYNIIVNPKYCRSKKIFFDTNLGLGSHYKQSDEALFMIDLFKSFYKNKRLKKSFFLAENLYAVSKSHINKKDFAIALQSKGYVARKAFNKNYLILLILGLIFACKYYKKYNPFRIFLEITKGFLAPKEKNDKLNKLQ